MFGILHMICFGNDNAFGEMFSLISKLVSPSEVVQAYIIFRNEIIVVIQFKVYPFLVCLVLSNTWFTTYLTVCSSKLYLMGMLKIFTQHLCLSKIFCKLIAECFNLFSIQLLNIFLILVLLLIYHLCLKICLYAPIYVFNIRRLCTKVYQCHCRVHFEIQNFYSIFFLDIISKF